jgi:insulysin
MDISPYDDRKYKYIKLSNDLEVVLIHDKKLTYSAASISVGVGSYYDPWKYQGLSHFLEHMLFMGSKKFPDENYFSEYVKQNGGYDNAYTANEITNYHFKIQSKGFEHALEIFARFFIDPLLTPDAIEREVKAVASEHSKNLTNDYWRFSGVLSWVSNKKSIYHKFGTGNMDSLYKDKLNDALIKHHSKYYSANNMKFVINSSYPLDRLENIVRKNYSSVPNKSINYINEIKPSLSCPLAFPYNYDMNRLNNCSVKKRRLGNTLKFIEILPIKKEHMLIIYWEILFANKNYKYGIKNILSYCLGHEGPGSIFYNLQQQNLASYLQAGVEEQGMFHCYFGIMIGLTDKGFKYRHQVLAIIHKYIDMMRKESLSKSIYNDYKRIAELKFNFRSKRDEASYVTDISKNMFYYDKEDIISEDELMNNYDDTAKRLYDKYMLLMQPETSIIIISSTNYLNTLNSTEKWYGVKYAAYDKVHLVSSQSFDQLEFNIYLPKNNNYIPSDTNIKKFPEHKYPIKLEMKNIECYWKFIKKYNRPKAYVKLCLTNHNMSKTLEDRYKLYMYISSKIDELNPKLYDAEEIGLSYGIMYDEYTDQIILTVYGYNDKLYKLMETLITEAKKGDVKKDIFDRIKEDYRKDLQNIMLEPPHELVDIFLKDKINKRYDNPYNILEKTNNITYNDVNSYGKNIFNGSFDFIQLIGEGNLSQDDIMKFGNLVTNKNNNIHELDFNKYKHTNIPDNLIIDKPVLNNLEQDSCTFIAFDIGYMDFRTNIWKEKKIASSITTIIFGDKFFNQLRTKEQLGYITRMSKMGMDSSYNMRSLIFFMVQSNVKDADYLETRINNFIENNMVEIIDNMTIDKFNTHKKTLFENIIKPYKNIKQEAMIDMYHIISRNYKFDMKEQLLEKLKEYTFDDYKIFIRKLLDTNPIIIKIRGNKETKK